MEKLTKILAGKVYDPENPDIASGGPECAA